MTKLKITFYSNIKHLCLYKKENIPNTKNSNYKDFI